MSPLLGSGEAPLIEPDDLEYLRGLAKATIARASKRESLPTLGYEAVTPGGNYPALWVRDFSMAAGCGLISAKTLESHLLTIAKGQNGPAERPLREGRAIIPPYAIADHLNYDGKAVFYPGTYSSGDDQGGEPYGVLPPVDDHYEFIHLAYLLWRRSPRSQVLTADLYSQLVLALNCPRWNDRTGLVETDAKTRAVGFGFCDGIYFTGALLFASLLRYRALGEMIEMAHGLGHEAGPDWQEQRNRIRENIPGTFSKSGWLKAATGVGGQPDVWGTVYAVYLDAIDPQTKTKLLKTLADAVKRGTITYKGAVRHVPTDHDFSATSAWEKTAGEELNRYQNGAYWHVPTGWLARALWQVDKPLARQVVREMIQHLREEDYRKGPGFGAPWECLHGTYRQNPIYMASVTLPLEALKERAM